MTMAEDPLQAYREKRDFANTPEPYGDDGGAGGEQPLFVVQEHAASSHHFDVRLEADGVLKSWAVPKGPSTDPSEKRLAVRTEDHPLDYGDFEGAIDEDEYGGGAVIVWDLGPYRNLTTNDDGDLVPVTEAIESKGHARVWLEGEKLRGGYSFVHARVGGDDDNWLLVKEDDDEADARRNPTSTEPESVLTGRTVADVAAEEGDESGG
ncbi:MAG: DNA polymerase ligase N-terminal domain-containing protein [Nitriliruptorales bacterium]|nr:DNA polymerase ligase N-terminal domain-containing protein [Nitriliruptorales bacterium]